MSDHNSVNVDRKFLEELLEHLKLERQLLIQVFNLKIDPNAKETIIFKLECLLK